MRVFNTDYSYDHFTTVSSVLSFLLAAIIFVAHSFPFFFSPPHGAIDEVPFYKFSLLDFTEPAQSFSRTVLPNFFSSFFLAILQWRFIVHAFLKLFCVCLNIFQLVYNSVHSGHSCHMLSDKCRVLFVVQCSPLLKGTQEYWK